ncbi:hypothetical protein ACI3EW_01000 [Pilosibacter sp. HC1M1C21]|uniref:hypothetical protein n=1 Tax=Pilosibacter sp. HC1M1C21 TaxID=3378803 RepID=UPI00385B4E21
MEREKRACRSDTEFPPRRKGIENDRNSEKKNKILGFIFAVLLAVWMLIFQNPSYAAQRGSLNVKTEHAMTDLYRVAEKQAGVYVLNEKFQASGADVSAVRELPSLLQIL